MVVVYSKPNCGACVATKRVLDKAGICYRVVDVSGDSAAREMLVEMMWRRGLVVFGLRVCVR